MRGTSAASLAAAQDRWEPVLRAAGEGSGDLGRQLFMVSGALDSSTQLRRSLTDPSRTGDDKAKVVAAILPGFDERVVDVVAGMVRGRWSSDRDLADATERLGVDALLAAAQSRGALERVEDELFRLSRALIGQREARRLLGDASVAPERRRDFAQSLLAGRADPVTAVLVGHAAMSPRGRRFVPMLGWFSDIAAERRQRLVAQVSSAAVLSQAHLDRLGDLLHRAYGREVQLNVTVDPRVIGGLRIQVGADVVDSTVLSRLADARRRLAS